MKTNELRKGTRVKLANGWEADIMDNLKGNTRLARVYGKYDEIGSVYAHDIVAYKNTNGAWNADIEYTPAQTMLRESIRGVEL